MISRWSSVIMLGVLLGGSGCDDGGGGDVADRGPIGDGGLADAEPPSPACIPDPARIAAGEACLDDVGCPCGTHCALGVCVAACTADDDCAGGRCDRFGRCTTREDFVVDAPDGPEGQLVVSNELIELPGADVPAVIAFGADGADLGAARVVADAALTLECLDDAGAASAADEGVCHFESLPADGTRHRVRATLGGDAEVASVRIYAGSAVRVVNLRLAAPEAAPEAQIPGHYRGVARLVAIGTRHVSDGEINVRAIEQGVVAVPLEVDIAADGRVRIVDAGHGITPHGEILGQMAFAGAEVFGEAQFEPWHHAVDGAWSPPGPARIPCGETPYACDGEWGDGVDEWTVWGSAAIPADGLRVAPGGLGFDLETRVHSFNPYRTIQRWDVALARVGDPLGVDGPSNTCRGDEAYVWPAAICLRPATTPEEAAATHARGDATRTSLNLAHPLYPVLESLFRVPVNADDVDRCLVQGLCRDVLGAIEDRCGTGCVPGTGVACKLLCVERTLCPDDQLSEVVEPLTGDLRCAADDGPAWSHPILVLDPARATGRAQALTCLAERTIGDAADAPTCFDGARWSRTMAHIAIAGRTVASTGNLRPRDVGAMRRLAQRMFQLWFEVDAAISRELSLDLNYSAALTNPGPGDLARQGIEDAQALLQGWDQILRPFPQGVSLLRGQFATLGDYDYRDDWGVRDQGPASMRLPMIVSAAEALTAQLEYVAQVVDLAHVANFGGALDADDAAAALALGQEAGRRALALTAFFTGFTEYGREGDAEWIAAWDQATMPALLDAITAVRNTTQRYQDDANPLGVDDRDVPASFDFRDTAGVEFTAISRFTFEQASRRLDEAEGSLDDARAEWAAFVERRAEERAALLDAETRADEIKTSFGQEIAELCGLPLGEALRVLDGELDPSDCFIVPECRRGGAALGEALSTAELGFSACYAGALRERLGPAVTTGDAALDAQLDAVAAAVRVRGGYPFTLAIDDADGAPAAQLVGVGGEALLTLPLAGRKGDSLIPYALPANADPDALSAARALCAPGRAAAEGERPGLPGACETSDACPVGMVCGGGRCSAGGIALHAMRPACFRGELGRAALGVRAAVIQHRAAQARFGEHQERYDLGMRECAKLGEAVLLGIEGCVGLRDYQQSVRNAEAAHDASMRTLRDVKMALEITGQAAVGLKDCASAANKGSGGALLSGGTSGAAGVVECGAAVVETGAAIGVTITERLMEDAEMAHADKLAQLGDTQALRECALDVEKLDVEIKACGIRAEGELIGARGSMLEARAALEARQIAQLDLVSGVQRVAGLLQLGRASLTGAEADLGAPLAPGRWLDDAVLDYQRDFARARQVAYLAARAAEYETQKSIGARAGIIAAGGLGDLEDALRALDDEVITPGTSVCGTAPSTLRTHVLSLRDQVLSLGSRADLPDGWQTLSATDRLRAELASPARAVFEDGQYVGQAIPFALDPAVFEATGAMQCAERIWLVNIGLVGGGAGAGVGMTLRQRNAFYSQSCTTQGERVLGAVRPSRNLYAVSTDYVPTRDDDRGMRSVSLTAFPRTREELVRLDASNGQSIEYQEGFSADLAGRGVYTEYELLVPAAQLAGLRIEQLQDVLIRIDMVAEQPCRN